MTAQERLDALEALLDDVSDPEALLDILSSVFTLKADHVRTNWQDGRTSRMWERWSDRTATFAAAAGSRIGNPYA